MRNTHPICISYRIWKIPARLEAAKTRKAETLEQLANAKTEVLKPFAYEDELKEKTDRLNIELNLARKTPLLWIPSQSSKTNSSKRKHRAGSVKSHLHICIAEIWAV